MAMTRREAKRYLDRVRQGLGNPAQKIVQGSDGRMRLVEVPDAPAPAPEPIALPPPPPPYNPASGQSVGPPSTGEPPPDVHQPGGDVLLRLQHPDFQTIEQLYRILPDDSWFQPSVSPSNPIQFELGAFIVPSSTHYWLYDYEFSVYRFSGVDAADTIKAEAGRFSGVMGFDITINGRRPSNLLYQLDPLPAQIQKQSFLSNNPNAPTNNASQFNRSTAQSFAAGASQGLSVLPVRAEVQGARGVPFTFVVKQGDRVALSVIIFKRVQTPIAAIEAKHGGYLLHSSLGEALLQRMRPR